jgi:outer membrane protein assembly factor BamD
MFTSGKLKAYGWCRLMIRRTRAVYRKSAALLAAGLLLALLAGGCSSSRDTASMSVEKRFELGMKKFNDGDYPEAYDDFRIVTLQYQGSAFSDQAQYNMGDCRYKQEQYILAAYEYDVLIRTMPSSKFASKARYQRAMCYYKLSPPSYLDQQPTKQAIDEFQSFIEYSPTDPMVPDAEAKIAELNGKLAKKEFESGMIYMKMEYYRSAALYFDTVLEKYYDTPYAEQALLRKAEALYQRNRFKEAQAELDKFLTKYPKSSYRKEAEQLRSQIQSGLSQSTGNAQKDSIGAAGHASR